MFDRSPKKIGTSIASKREEIKARKKQKFWTFLTPKWSSTSLTLNRQLVLKNVVSKTRQASTTADRNLIRCRFHQHFTWDFCTNIFAPKNFKPKMLPEKSCAKHLYVKNYRVKCWWNWLQNNHDSDTFSSGSSTKSLPITLNEKKNNRHHQSNSILQNLKVTVDIININDGSNHLMKTSAKSQMNRFPIDVSLSQQVLPRGNCRYSKFL